ncbi:MAG: metallophosphoesterase [Firmicutes bacterium]|nr:metallophosphoesterase [Bacillota bacterium]
MRIFAISDLHLSTACDKPMDIFGGAWDNYPQVLLDNWQSIVKKDDIVLVAGDISWAMKLDEALPDLQIISKLNGTKILIKGNHDYWWSSVSKIRNLNLQGMVFLQNDSIKIGEYIFCGTRGWSVLEPGRVRKDEDKKIYLREIERLKLSLADVEKKRTTEKVICLAHYPPFNSKKHDSEFTNLYEQHSVDIVVYGHLHGKGGLAMPLVEKGGIKYYLTSTDKLGHKPLLINE